MHHTTPPTIEKEECELDLTKPEDRKLFSEAAEDLYIDAMNYEPHARVEQYNLLALPEITGREVFQTAEQILIEIQKMMQQTPDITITNEQIDTLQSLYNDLATICGYIEGTCQRIVPETPSDTAQPKNTVVTDKKSVSIFPDKEVIGRRQRIDLALHQTEAEATGTLKITVPKQFPPPPSAPAQKPNLTPPEEQATPLQKTEFRPQNSIPPLKTFSPGILKPHKVLDERSLTAQYLQSKMYADFISSHYTSATAFERLLDIKITQIEEKTTDAIERWLGEKHQSPFIFLQDKTIAEVLALSQNSDIRTIIQEADIKYETFLTWIDFLPNMLSSIEIETNKTFGELFARYIIETEMENKGN